jgi:asparagine synthase (glutamine-hydrolysing)
MSGIVGLINLDGTPVDPALLREMTDFLAFRGPDAQTVWTEGAVGLGHALLRATDESKDEQQPCSLDGAVWITADARVDARRELVQELRGRGREVAETLPDATLILHAYHAWGDDCVRHLLGDFAFAIWDGRQRRLFCARDHFGVKPFFYAPAGGCLVFGNTLDGVRLHPSVSDRLNERYVGDFLLFGCNEDPAASVFADVQRLPAAHTLTWSAEGVRLQRYWKLPADGDLRYRREAEYVEHFKDLFRRAVEDRLRTDRAAVYMSGGLDSSAVAAVALKLARPGNGLDLRAFTTVFDELIPDEERLYSGLVGRALNLPINYLCADGYRLYERQEQEELHTPEPRNAPLSAAFDADQRGQILAHARVALTGYGGDPAFLGSADYVLNLLKGGRLGRLAVDFWRCLARGRLPKVGFRARLRRWLGKTPAIPYPTWLSKDFEAEVELRARWQDVNAPSPREHPRRPEAYRGLTAPFWPSNVFEPLDPGVTRCAFEVRHPFFDVRLLTYVLAIPALPWCDHKELLRRALTGLLPETIRLRPKTPLRGDPIRARIRRDDCGRLDRFAACPELDRFVDRQRLPSLAGETDTVRFLVNARPYCLNNWLRLAVRWQRGPSRGHRRQEEHRPERGSPVLVSLSTKT